MVMMMMKVIVITMQRMICLMVLHYNDSLHVVTYPMHNHFLRNHHYPKRVKT